MNIKKIGIGVAGFVVVLTGGVLITPQLFKSQIQDAVLELSKEFVTTEVKMDDLSISFFKNFPQLSVSLENLSIQAPESFGQLKTVETQSVDLGIDLMSLFSDQIKFTQLHINQGKFNVVTDSIGNFSFAIFKTSDEPSEDAPFDLALNKIFIKNSDVLYQDDTSKIKIETKNTTLNGDVQVTDKFIDLNTNADILSTFIKMDESVYVDNKSLKGKVNTRVYLKPMAVEFKENNLFLAQLPLQITGGLKMLDKGIDFDLKIDTKNASLAELFSLVPTDFQNWYDGMTFDGKTTIGVRLKGLMQENVSKPNLDIAIDIQEGKIGAKAYSKDPVEHLNTKVQIAMPSLHADSLAVNVPEFNFTLGKGFAKGKAIYKMPMFVDAEVKSELDVTQLWKTLALDGMKLQGNVSLEGVVKGSYLTKENKTKSGKIVSEIVSVPTFNINAQWKNGFFQWNQMPMPLDAVAFDLKAKNTDGNYLHTAIDIDNIDTKAGKNYIKGKVKVENLVDYNMDANLQAFVELAEVKKIFPIDNIDFAGQLTIDTNAKGKLDWKNKKIPVVQSIFKLKDGFLRYNDLPELPLEKVQLETHITSPRGSMNDLRVNVLPISFVLAGEPFQLDANLFNFNNLVFDIGTKGKLNLGNIYKVFKVDGWDVEGRVEADVKVKGKGGANDPSSINNRGFVLLKDIRVKSDYFPHEFVFSNGRFKFLRKQIEMENVQMNYDKQTFRLNGSLENYINYFLTNTGSLKGKLTVETDYLDVNSFMANANTAPAANKPTKSGANGVVMLPDRIDFELTAKSKKVRFNDLELKNLEGVLKVLDQKLHLENTQFELIDTPFQLSANYKALNSKYADFDFHVIAKSFDIQKAYKELTLFREMAKAAEKASGQVSLDYQLKGKLNKEMFPIMPTLVGGGDLTLENIQFQGFNLFNQVSEETGTGALRDANFKDVVVKSTIENNIITLPRTKFKVSFFRPRIEGQVSLKGDMNLGIRIGLPPFGIIGIPVTVKGNASDFKIDIGKYKEEDLTEDDEDYLEYKKSLEEQNQLDTEEKK